MWMTILRDHICSTLFSKLAAVRSTRDYTGFAILLPTVSIRANIIVLTIFGRDFPKKSALPFIFSDDVAFVISLMRSGESSRFSAREFRILKGVAPIIISLAQRHWEDVPKKFNTGNTVDQAPIEDTVSTLFSQRITPRETQVVAQVLEGHSSESIAKNLAISVGTVRIHRRNIYAKLQISSQQELFSMFFKKITAGRG